MHRLNYLNFIETGQQSNVVSYNCNFSEIVHLLQCTPELKQVAIPHRVI